MPPFMSAVPRPVIRPSRRYGDELGPVLDRDDVEVAVEVDQALAVAHPAADDPGLFERGSRLELEDLRCEAEPIHLLMQQFGARGQAAPGRVFRPAGHQANQQIGHVIRVVVNPLHDLGGYPVAHGQNAIADEPEDGPNFCATPDRC